MSRKEVDIPTDLRAALLGEDIVKHIGSDVEEGSKPSSHLASLLGSRASEVAAMDDDELVKEIRSISEKLWGKNPRQYECRVINGSYTVTRFVESDLSFPRVSRMATAASKLRGSGEPENREGGVEEEEEEGPQRATQRIETVFSASLFYRVLSNLARFTGGKTMKEESKVIAEGINLCLKPGKMYLVLGLPGSGKSTLLKMIANTLPQDDKHVKGGEVFVNGMSSSEKKVVWSVSVSLSFASSIGDYLTDFRIECFLAHRSNRPASSLHDGLGDVHIRMEMQGWIVTPTSSECVE